jgi:hypothetical protein
VRALAREFHGGDPFLLWTQRAARADEYELLVDRVRVTLALPTP